MPNARLFLLKGPPKEMYSREESLRSARKNRAKIYSACCV
jgi:hypothetical protein